MTVYICKTVCLTVCMTVCPTVCMIVCLTVSQFVLLSHYIGLYNKFMTASPSNEHVGTPSKYYSKPHFVVLLFLSMVPIKSNCSEL